MSTPRFYCPILLAPGRRVTLPDLVARHALGVLRLRSGDPVILFNGEGGEYAGTLEKAGKHAEVTLSEKRNPERESPLQITLVQGISSGERMDFTLQKAVELGVSAIQPVMMRRSIVRMDHEKRLRRREHWQAVVISACEQCGRNLPPPVAPIEEFPDWLRNHVRTNSNASNSAIQYLLDPEANTRLRDLQPPSNPMFLIAGPEGGFDRSEHEFALSQGVIPLNLGPRILRTETAALAAVAAMQSLWGDL